jgi:hypothetical protein
MRYTARPFPAYAYVPGEQPHPTRDPAGHSYEPTPKPRRRAAWSADQWGELDDWLYGVDLFNAHYFWEAHEAWEGLWAACDRDSTQALFLQGLIQIAAALLKARMGSAGGVRALSQEGLEKLHHVAAEQPQFMGLDLQRTVVELTAYFARSEIPELSELRHLTLALPEA